MTKPHINVLFFSLIMGTFLILFLSELCFSRQSSDLVDRSQYSYLKGSNINIELLKFDNVQSYCFICWGDGIDDPYTGRQSYDIVYINNPDFKVRTSLASVKNNKSIIFRINFYKFSHEQIVKKIITLPDDRVSFYSHLISQNHEGNQNDENISMKLNILSGYIELKTLGGNSINKTVGNFTIRLSNNAVIEGGFSVRSRISGYGP